MFDGEKSADPTSGGINQGRTSSETIADHVLGDQPAATRADDKLGFATYVNAVAKFLTDSSTKIPLTLSIEGLWGAGKSSFMLQLQEALENLGKKKIVSFNAWQYDPDDSLWAAFMDEFDAKLTARLNWKEKLRSRYRLLALRISWRGWIDTAVALVWLVFGSLAAGAITWYMLHGGIDALRGFLKNGGKIDESTGKTIALVGGVGGSIAVVLLFLNQIKDLFKSPASLDRAARLFAKPKYGGKLPLIHEVTRDFQSLVSAYAGDEGVYVFIDDLDRCEYSKAAELMQLLLVLLSTAPNIALIIGLDRDKVAAAMAAKQEKLLPYLYKVQPAEAYLKGMDYGRLFIEKFIQLSYILPAPRSNGLKAMINPVVEGPSSSVPESQKSVKAIEIATGKDDSGTLNIMIDMADVVFGHNPRNVKQFVNMFRLQAFIANETGLFGSSRVTRDAGRPLTIPQLGKFVALCMRWPEFVEAASADPNLVAEMEEWISKGHGTPAGPPSKLAVWGRDKDLMLLLSFTTLSSGMSAADFSLGGVDFGVLTEIAPARARSAFEQRDSAPSANDLRSQSSPPEVSKRAPRESKGFRTIGERLGSQSSPPAVAESAPRESVDDRFPPA